MSDDAKNPDSADPAPGTPRGPLGELARLFLKLGIIAFGGPAAHIAMLEDEVVTRRGWLSRQHFLDLVGATNLIPGPNSTEMTMHIGFERAGWKGLFTAGACFILPAVLVTGGFAWLYVGYGSLPEVEPFLYGIKPAVIAVILGAVWKLGRTAVKGWRFGVLGLGVAAAVLGGLDEVWALLAGGLLGTLWLRAGGYDSSRTAGALVPILFLRPSAGIGAGATRATGVAGVVVGGAGAVTAVSLWKLFFFFLKIGAILYGSGYVLVAFLEGGLVQDYGWLTQPQLLDAIAIGQLTPGPVLSTATFIGYVVEGVPGAAVATLGIFLPSFFFVLILNPLIPRLRESVWLSAFLDAVNVAAVALMVAVTIELGVGTLVAWPAWVIAALATVLALVYRVNAAWLVAGGAVLGWLLYGWV
ncbi:MAG TPA: chromate efflux transporter [Gemmatimonadota bacterium]|nr:chromate efflux transporter [Gemmatimonadota bacterium]